MHVLVLTILKYDKHDQSVVNEAMREIDIWDDPVQQPLFCHACKRTVATVYFGKIDLCLCWVALSEGPRPFGLLRDWRGSIKEKRLQSEKWSRCTTEETGDEPLYTIACLLPHCVGAIMPQLRVGFQPLGWFFARVECCSELCWSSGFGYPKVKHG